MNLLNYSPIINEINFNEYKIGVLRLDLIDPEISGNKWFKLKYNLQQAITEQKKGILTFGGAFSNHIAATAKACQIAKLHSIGIIRGDENSDTNTTLALAIKNGMQLHFVSRQDYKNKSDITYLSNLQQQFPDYYIVPEGGDNALGSQGCKEILTEATNQYQQLFCAFGTGSTFRGIAQSLKPHQQLTAINVLKFEANSINEQTVVNNHYHFGGYVKHTKELLDFKLWFENQYTIELDYVYTAKLFYAVFDLMKTGRLNPENKTLIIHSGGLQGNVGYEQRYKIKSSGDV